MKRRVIVIAYHGYLPFIKSFLASAPSHFTPTLLEVGVDRGVTFVTLATFLARTREKFVMLGVDVNIQEQVQIMIANLDLEKEQQCILLQQNSLQTLPELIKRGAKFDVVLIDGDHNYHTVCQELACLNQLTHQHSIVIIDDYDGRWSTRDLWYAQKDEYVNVKDATQPIETMKHGVKPAVDEFLEANPQWELLKPIQGEPVLLRLKSTT